MVNLLRILKNWNKINFSSIALWFIKVDIISVNFMCCMKYNILAEWIRVVLLHIEEQGESILEAVYDFVIFFSREIVYASIIHCETVWMSSVLKKNHNHMPLHYWCKTFQIPLWKRIMVFFLLKITHHTEMPSIVQRPNVVLITCAGQYWAKQRFSKEEMD